MYDALTRLLEGDDFHVVEKFDIPGREAEYAEIPRFLFDSSIGLHLHRQFKGVSTGGPLWRHQARSLELLGAGDNVVVSTGTASGKSLVFRSLAFHKTLLDPESRVLVFYPLKALAADQRLGWQEMASTLGLGDGYVGRIDGSIPVKEREDILQRARIVLMTPDVCHAWLMSRLSLPPVRAFMRQLSTLVLDEAHTLEAVFGSNFAFLMRRLMAVRNHLLGMEMEAPLQFVAATATIKDPGEHLSSLTGASFSVVDHLSDGAPRHHRVIAHVACPPREGTAVAKALQDGVLSGQTVGGFITFLDSRKGVETLAAASEPSSGTDPGKLLVDATVLPYRAGFAAQDRTTIERRLQDGSLRGVVSTSALELGIDIPYLRVGLNVGIPDSRKGYRQRLGRIGRVAPGAFVVVAPKDAFARYGTSLREYHDMSVESSYLYLDNRFMQFAHGRCLADELESIAAPPRTPPRVAWPAGFEDMHAAARPGGNRAPEFDAIAALGGDSPQYGYPIRNVGEASFKIKVHANADPIGEVSQQQALRECYPGATYLHLTKAYEVTAWHASSFESFIRVKPTSPFRRTSPRSRTWINAGITPTDIQGGHIVQDENGFLAECLMQVTQRVEGYVDQASGNVRMYKDLQQRNPNMKPRMRNFRTTGVVLCVKGGVFANGATRRAFAEWLGDAFAQEFSVAPRDVSAASTNISVRSLDGGGHRSDCIAIYDETYGSLRLTERLYLHFGEILERLQAGVLDASGEELLDPATVEAVRGAVAGFVTVDADPLGEDAPSDLMDVFAEGSRVCYQKAGQMAVEVEVLRLTIMEGKLMYQISAPVKPGQSPGKMWVSASLVEPSAEAGSWEYRRWDPATEEYVDGGEDGAEGDQAA